jgi:hypothetical protein
MKTKWWNFLPALDEKFALNNLKLAPVNVRQGERREDEASPADGYKPKNIALNLVRENKQWCQERKRLEHWPTVNVRLRQILNRKN